MKSKMGRPTLPKGKAKGAQLGVRFTTDDDRQIEKAAEEAGQTKVAWIRDKAVESAQKPSFWVKSKWTREDIQRKYVEFKLTDPKFIVQGIGQFLVRKNPRGELAIDICIIKAENPYKMVEIRYHIGQEAADRIDKHPNPEVADFRLPG